MQNEEPSIVGDIIFDLCHPHIPLNGVETLDFLGISCYEYDQGLLEVRALCIKPVEDYPGVFERVGVAWIQKDVWDQVAQFDENIILG
jgi:hypothetical protein